MSNVMLNVVKCLTKYKTPAQLKHTICISIDIDICK